ncbi:MAG TPA: response regulator, partial [Burkholderiaceae bacterium]
LHREDRPYHVALAGDTARSGQPFTLEQRFVLPDSASLWVSCNVTRLVDAQARPQALLAVVTDISVRRRAEDALRNLNETLEQRVAHEVHERAKAEEALRQVQKMEAIGQLTGGVAHDFNNVLQIISSNLQLLQTQSGDSAVHAKRLHSAIAAVDRGAKLSSHLLAFARRQPLQPAVISLARLLRGMDDLIRRAVGEAVAIELETPDDLWNTLVDPSQLENVILNLAINARDAMNGAGRVLIRVRNLAPQDQPDAVLAQVHGQPCVLLEVADNGSGMPPEVVEKAFEPFFTTKPEGEGTGLGLSMAYGFVKQSGGHIAIDSEAGRGTTIRVYLPRSLDAETELAELAHGPVAGGTETILVVEDDAAVRATVVDMLGSLGYRVLKAASADEGLLVLESGAQIDLLFTDVVMPGALRGPELAERARALIPGLSVLFTSGYTQNAMQEGGKLKAGVELLSKPYRMEQLARKIRHMLANARQRDYARALPRQAAPSKQAIQQYEATHPEVEVTGSTLKVLVVEDNLDAQFLVCEMLMALGHEADGAVNAEQAQQALAANSYNILFTDINLPGMSGVDLAKHAVALQPAIKVIFASGYGADVGRHLEFPSIALPKPYDLMQLQDALDRI